MATDFSRFPELRAAALPVEDQDILRSLSLDELPAWIDGRVEEIQRRIGELLTRVATLRHLRNMQCAPVSHLPNEVLMRVFGDPSLADCGSLIRGVCRLWRSILLNTTSFWANYISGMHLGRSTRHESKLRVALLRSGAVSLALDIRDTDIWIFRVLETCRARIAKWAVHLSDNVIPTSVLTQFIHSGSMTRLHSLSVHASSHSGPLDWDTSNLPALRSLDILYGIITPSIMVSSLESLTLVGVHLTLHSLVDILKRCPILTTLSLRDLRLRHEQQNSYSASSTVHLPLLRQLRVNTLSATDVAPFLGVFVCIPEHAFVELWMASREAEYQLCGIASLPFINRLYIENAWCNRAHLKLCGYVDSLARLCIEYAGNDIALAKSLQPFLACPLTTLVIQLENPEPQTIRERHGHIFTLELPRIRRLELPPAGSRAAKQMVTELFLGRYRTRASELSLAWVLYLRSDKEARSLAAEEVEALLTVLREHVRCGNSRLGRLEMYAVEYMNRHPFAGDIKADSDARICSQVVEPFLAELRGLVDEVHIG